MGARGVAIGTTAFVLLAGGAVLADRVAVGRAEELAATALQANVEGVSGDPEVTIGGFPFLTQLAAGKLSHVTARAATLLLDGVEVTDVVVDADGVSTTEPYTVDRADLIGTLSAAELRRLVAASSDIDVDLQIENDELTAGTQVLGLDVTVTLVPRVDNGEIRVDAATVAFGGFAVDVADLPGVLAGQLSDLAVPVAGLPAGFELSGVEVQDSGARITATGVDVVLPVAAASPAP